MSFLANQHQTVTLGLGISSGIPVFLLLGFGNASSTSYTQTARGGMVMAGAATDSFSRAQSASGGLSMSGAATVSFARQQQASGGLTMGGSATVDTHVASYTQTARGGLSMGGTASYSFNGGSGGNSGRIFRRRGRIRMVYGR